MSRKSNVIEAEAEVIAHDILSAAAEPNAIMQARAKEVSELKPLFDYLGTDQYDEAQFKSEARSFVMQSAGCAYEAGVRLTILKGKMQYGEFSKFCEEDLPCGRRHAYTLIELVRHVSQLAEASGGKIDARKLRSLETKKVLALGYLAQQSPDDLKDGKIAGKTLDEIAITPRAELEAQVREAKRQLTLKQKGNATLQEKIDTLDKQLREYREVTDTTISRACMRLRQGIATAINEFNKTPKPTARELEINDIPSLHEVLSFATYAITNLRNYVCDIYPEYENFVPYTDTAEAMHEDPECGAEVLNIKSNGHSSRSKSRKGSRV